MSVRLCVGHACVWNTRGSHTLPVEPRPGGARSLCEIQAPQGFDSQLNRATCMPTTQHPSPTQRTRTTSSSLLARALFSLSPPQSPEINGSPPPPEHSSFSAAQTLSTETPYPPPRGDGAAQSLAWKQSLPVYLESCLAKPFAEASVTREQCLPRGPSSRTTEGSSRWGSRSPQGGCRERGNDGEALQWRRCTYMCAGSAFHFLFFGQREN